MQKRKVDNKKEIKGKQAFKTLTRYGIYKREGFLMGNFSFVGYTKNGFTIILFEYSAN